MSEQAWMCCSERYAAPRLRLRGRLGRFRADLVRCDLSPNPQPPRQDPNRPRTVCRSTPPTNHPGGLKPAPSNKSASVENLFPLSPAATPCGTNRNLQQKNHSNFTVTSPHSPNTMTPGRHHDIRCDLPPSQARLSSPLQIPDPHGSQLVGRACVDQVVADFSPTRIQTRKPVWSTVTNPLRGNLVPADHICCPTWQHLHFTTDLPQLTAFTPPFSRPGATRFSPHDRHAKPCLRSDWARREADPNRPPGLLPMRPIRTWPKPCMGNRLRGNPVHNATIYHLSWQHPRRVTEKPQLAGRCRCHEGCTPQGRHEAPAAAPPESVHLPICPWTVVGAP